jgi:glutamine synthetase
MTEVMNADGTPHSSNGRATIDDDGDFWFGFEQEYFIMDTKTLLLLGFPIGGYPAPLGMYYCSVGGKTHTEALVEEHADLCIAAGINFEGINQEVLWPMGISIVCTRSKKKQGTKWVALFIRSINRKVWILY